MNQPIAALSSLAVLALVACASEPARPPAATPPVQGKAGAPVQISATAAATAAEVRVLFEVAGTDVSIEVRGVDGLRVTGPAQPVRGASYPAGGVATLSVPYTAPSGESNLVVTVQGRFGNAVSSRVASFTVGSPSPQQLKQSQQGVGTDSQGERVRVVPAERAP
jgi:hypothetical protein